MYYFSKVFIIKINIYKLYCFFKTLFQILEIKNIQ